MKNTHRVFSSQEEMNEWILKQQKAAANQIVNMAEIEPGVWKKPIALPENK